MACLDFRLRHLKQKLGEVRVHVLVEFKNDHSGVSDLEFQETSRFGKIAAGSIPIYRLDELSRHPDVLLIEGSYQLKDEMDVSLVDINLYDASGDVRSIPSEGNGVVIGIIDSGFDLTHPCFCDADGKTRILSAWDQANLAQTDGTPPDIFDYGIEYTSDFIDRQIEEQKLLVTKNHPLGGAHGTFVAGVAAGNGYLEKVFTGVAPQASLILVTYKNDRPIGGSAFVLDAISFILNRARRAGMPVVINLSQGDNLGAHDGTSLLERAIDYLSEHEGVLFVNSIGNEGGGKRHVHDRFTPVDDFTLLFELKETEGRIVNDDTIDLWYQCQDRVAVVLTTPHGWQSVRIEPDTESTVTFPNGTRAFVCSETNYPANGANRIMIILEEGGNWENGTWKLLLHGNEVKHGYFDAWADCPNAVSVISFPNSTDDCTVTLPGTSSRIFTVSASVSRASKGLASKAVKGDIGLFTSCGPTRDKRFKPNITAPGFFIMVPGTHKIPAGTNPGSYWLRSGTSLAAPHVSGVAALLLSLNPALTAEQIAHVLEYTAKYDKFTGTVPNNKWGTGKLNAGAAYKALFSLAKKEEQPMTVQTQELNLNVPNSDGTATSPIQVRFTMDDGNVIRIEATGPQHEYTGQLLLKGKGLAEGGDHCVVCPVNGGDCQIIVPCPE